MLPAGLRDAALDALAVLLPVECAGCGEPDRALCDSCRAALAPAPIVRALDPARPGTPVVAGLGYDGAARRVILAFKDSDRPGLAHELAPALAAAARETAARLGPAGAVLCPIPSTRRARRRRGYAPVDLLARAAGLRLAGLLAAGPAGRTQKGLAAGEREANARSRVRLRRGVHGLDVVLLDDVVTTGATLRAAARELEHGGARVLGAVVLAATPLRRDADLPRMPSPRPVKA